MHPILKAALDSAPEALRAGPHHGGVDANPQLTSFGYCGVAIFMAEACAHHVRDVIEEEERDEWLREAKNIYSRHARAVGKEVKERTKSRLRVLSDKELLAARRKIVTESTASRKGSLPVVLPIPLRAANLALFAAVDIEAVSNQAYVLMALKTVAGQITRVLRGERVMAFLRDLDRVLVREELRAILAQRRDPRCEKIEACAWRGAGTGAKITHWIGRLADGSFLLLWKVGSRWQIITGGRDELLASVSDSQMESAVNALVSTRASA